MERLLENHDDLMDWKRQVLKNVGRQLNRRDFLKAAAVGAAALGHLPLLSGPGR